MDPASGLIGIASGAVTLAALALKIGRALKGIVTAYKQSAAVIYPLIGACKAIELAWDRIDGWVQSQVQTSTTEDSAFYEQLTISIEVGKAVLGSLEQDLEGYADIKPGQHSASFTWKILLSEDVLRDHCTRLTLQLSSLQLLVATASLPALETRNVLCDYLKPIFRKDEESAWTIVASGTRSSVLTCESGPKKVGEETESLYSVRHFDFTNDLLTAPVYKRLTLKMLRSPKPVPNHFKASFPRPTIGPVWPVRRTTWLDTPPNQIFNPVQVEKQTTFPKKNDVNSDQLDLLRPLAHGAEAIFSPSAVNDVGLLHDHPLDFVRFTPKYLPWGATLRRMDMTPEERVKLDRQLLWATRDGSEDWMATCLDMGADINATHSSEHGTPLQVAIWVHNNESAALFLLHYQNVNVHMRDGRGRTALHDAVSCGKVRTIKRLLDMDVSMIEPDEAGITPFMIATTDFTSTEPLAVLLEHAASCLQMKTEQITEMDPLALHRAFATDLAYVDNHVHLLFHYGWPLSVAH